MFNNLFKGLVLVDTGRLRRPKVNTPDGLTIRIFSNGEVYPSKELVDRLNLEYKNKPAEGEEEGDQGFGFDVVDSLEWEPTKTFPRTIILGHVSKTKPKVDLFSNTRYNEDNTPKATVLSQGTVSTTLLELVRSLGYMSPDQKYCDLVLDVDNPIVIKDGLSWIPKTIERGERKGQKDTQRRENSTYYVATSADSIQQQPVATTSTEVTN